MKQFNKWVQASLLRFFPPSSGVEVAVDGRDTQKYRTAVRKFRELNGMLATGRRGDDVTAEVANELIRVNEANKEYVTWVEEACNRILGRSGATVGNIDAIRKTIKDCQKKSKFKNKLKTRGRRGGSFDGVVGYKTELALKKETGLTPPIRRSRRPVAPIPELTVAEIEGFTRVLFGSQERPAAFIDDQRESAEEIKNLILTEMQIFKVFQAIAGTNFVNLVWIGAKRELNNFSFSTDQERDEAIVNYFAGMAHTLVARGRILEVGNSPGTCDKRLPSLAHCESTFEKGQRDMRDRIDTLRENRNFKKGIDAFFVRIKATKNKALAVRAVHNALMKMYLRSHPNEKTLRKRANCGNFRFPNFPVNGLTCTSFRKV